MITFFIIGYLTIFSQDMAGDFRFNPSTHLFSGKDTTIWVTATAYNATEEQTEKGSVGIGAWGDRLSEDMKVIAVSHDLLDMGLSYKTKVRIEGLKGVYVVMDKMHSRWTKKIDIFMGLDRDNAIKWGKKKVKITFPVHK
jgi:3D (Asp-Asp-Asp) domain-containing protein